MMPRSTASHLSTLLAAAQFAGALARLLDDGVALPDALNRVAGEMTDPAMTDAVRRMAARCRDGESLSASLGAVPAFPPVLTCLADTGERGAVGLVPMLRYAAEIFERDADHRISGWADLVEASLADEVH